jgi:hypothetical protein
MKGYRNLMIVASFLVWCLIETWLVARVAGDDLAGVVTSLGVMFTGVGGAVVGAIFGRGFNKKAEREAP